MDQWVRRDHKENAGHREHRDVRDRKENADLREHRDARDRKVNVANAANADRQVCVP